jgi:integrase
LKFHPLAQVGPRAFGLKKNIRTVFLDNREIRAYWRAADRMGYPYGPYYQLLLIFALRLSDLSGARWSEFDWADRMFTVPDERHKSGADFLVPVCDLAFEILSRLPGFNSPQKGDFLFSYYEGTSPINSFSKAKKTLDEFMLDELRAEAQEQGADPARVRVKRFVNHDTRRVVRTNLPRLGVADNVCELVIAHGKKGLARIYDQYKYSPQITQALQLWGEELRSIVGLPPFKPVDDK